ncbi:hypothetical protein [Changchengzhania lutea]|uniref:hypothetical protein n=1 Tax=Changchengzhania lutea TaxID=2049305 RepID=UPI001FEB9336|nr:hypothetical protein [Changchengzhania lutea]
MLTKHKISAYTISEMIVVLIITSIVVGMAFSVLRMVQKHMNSIQHNLEKTTELNKLEQSLWLDFNRHSKIEYDTIEDELVFSSEIDTISYRFSETYIIKDIDTFNIPLKNKTFFFDGTEVPNDVIDALKIETSKVFQNQQLFVFKQNDATLFMN